jgi:hypothetical protein
MADKAKDKRAAVLEKIKALKAGRASDGPTAHDGDAPGGAKGPKRAPKQTGPSHRPQGG